MAAMFTIGIEEEYQVVDPVTGALRSAGTRVREADWTDTIIPEMQESTIEIGTPVCSTAADARDQLQQLRVRTATVAESAGLAIIAAGLHPFSRWEGHTIPDNARYRSIVKRYGRIARDEHIFGMHIHVAVDPPTRRLELMNVLRHYLPHLLALSCSSAFFEGEDTGFASYRTILWRRWPSSGIPPRFRSEQEFESYVSSLLASGAILDRGNLYWSMRQHAAYPTIEFRVTDVCPSIDDAVAIGALARALVAAVADGKLEDESPKRLSSALEQEVLRANEWRASRDGLNAILVNGINGRDSETARDAIRRILDVVTPYATELGDAAAIAHVSTILSRGNAADRMREIWRQDASLTGLTDWLQAESVLGIGMDRRLVQRAE